MKTEGYSPRISPPHRVSAVPRPEFSSPRRCGGVEIHAEKIEMNEDGRVFSAYFSASPRLRGELIPPASPRFSLVPIFACGFTTGCAILGVASETRVERTRRTKSKVVPIGARALWAQGHFDDGPLPVFYRTAGHAGAGPQGPAHRQGQRRRHCPA